MSVVDDMQELGERIRLARIEQFGTASRAYQAAGLSAPTWKAIEDGRPTKTHSLAAAVRLLWPSSGGDWRRIDDDPIHTESGGPLAAYSDAELVAELARRLAR